MPSYHYTCVHAAEKIEAAGFVLTPNPQPMLGRLPMLWFSTMRYVPRGALGLSSRSLTCDRMEVLYQVHPDDEDKLAWWGDLKASAEFADLLPGARRLEGARGTRPGIWKIALDEVRVLPTRL